MKFTAKTLLTLAFVSLVHAASADVRHFVAFRFKPTVSAAERAQVRVRFLALADLCRNKEGKPYVVSIESGDANSPEGADQGLQQGYLVTFRNEDDRNYYVGRPFFKDFDPAHDAFKVYVGPLLDVDAQGKVNGAFVFDYTTGNP